MGFIVARVNFVNDSVSCNDEVIKTCISHPFFWLVHVLIYMSTESARYRCVLKLQRLLQNMCLNYGHMLIDYVFNK
jgi:hypothetical protein